MPSRYAPLPNPRSEDELNRELDEAFGESDHDENDDEGQLDTESTPLTATLTSNASRDKPSRPVTRQASILIPGTYDFEREYDYDYPPPGSPPRPSSVALPNDYGNSNGRLPSTPAVIPGSRPSFFRQAVGALLPSHYVRVPGERGRPRGGGIENDGVFANVAAKPSAGRAVQAEDGSVHVVPEVAQNEAPPSYRDAQADAVPPYWETTVHAPSGYDVDGVDMVVGDLPTGSFFIFAANMFTSFFFQFIGFLLTYLLHTSHAAKYGSRAGLGLTLIQYGFYSRSARFGGAGDDGAQGTNSQGSVNNGPAWGIEEVDSPLLSTSPPSDTPQFDEGPLSHLTTREWLSFLLMTLGWFLLLSSFIGFWRVKRWEKSIRAARDAHPSPVDVQRDQAVRRTIAAAFGIDLWSTEDEGWDHPAESVSMRGPIPTVGQDGSVIVIPGEATLEEERLTRDLRTAGLL